MARDTDRDYLTETVDHLLGDVGCSLVPERCNLELTSYLRSSPSSYPDNSQRGSKIGLETSASSLVSFPGCVGEEIPTPSMYPDLVHVVNSSTSDCPIPDELGSDVELLEFLDPLFPLPSEMDSCLSSLLASPVIAQAISSSLQSPVRNTTVETNGREMYSPVKTATDETHFPVMTTAQEVCSSPVQSISRQLYTSPMRNSRGTGTGTGLGFYPPMKTWSAVTEHECRRRDSNNKSQDSEGASWRIMSGKASGTVNTPKWKLSCNIGKRLLEGFSVPDIYHDKGYVSLGRLLLGAPLKGLYGTDSVAPFVVGTEFPDLDYGPDSIPGALEPNQMFFGVASLESDHCSLIFDTENPYPKEREEGVKMQGVPNLTVHRLPLKSFHLGHLVRDLAWAPSPSQDCLLACVASGAALSLFRWEVSRHRVQPIVQEVEVHSDIIRSISVHGNALASGGFDGQLHLFQLEHLTSDAHPPTPVFQHSVDDVISCVSWRTPHCICCSTDGGQLVLVDTRASRRKKPPLQIDTNRGELYCHAFCGVVSNHVMLGYGGGTVAEADIRKPKRILQDFQDPVVSAIGDISIHPQSGHMITMGTRGFTLWSKPENSYEMTPRASGYAPSSPNTFDMECSTSGGFIPETPFYAVVDTYGIFSVADTKS